MVIVRVRGELEFSPQFMVASIFLRPDERIGVLHFFEREVRIHSAFAFALRGALFVRVVL
jgi:hypothetical protein